MAREASQRGIAGYIARTTGLPLLCNVAPRFEAARTVVRRLVPDESLITAADIEQSFRACDANIREMLFRLYDLYEARTR